MGFRMEYLGLLKQKIKAIKIQVGVVISGVKLVIKKKRLINFMDLRDFHDFFTTSLFLPSW